jgi:AraC family transcriptional regulator
MESLIKQAVELMEERYPEPLTLDDMASAAVMSKFHFIRIFRGVVGVTPGRYLGAVRIQEAKRLLRTTPLNVSDVAVGVGYCSTGSFTRRFSESVGCSPIQYRNNTLQPFAIGRPNPASGSDSKGFISGKLLTPTSAVIFKIGVFDTPIAEGPPIALTEADDSGTFFLGPMPPGQMYVHAIGRDLPPCRPGQIVTHELLVGGTGPVVVTAGGHVEVEIDVHVRDWTDLPVLFALLDPEPLPSVATPLAS